MSDTQLTSALGSAVAVIDPLLDLIAERDVLGLKAHTFDSEREHRGRVDQAQHLLAGLLDIADWPGTRGWADRSMNERADWWISRIGTVNTAAVAYPGVFGGWAKALPITTALGFANQATVLIAIAREYGVTDRTEQVRLLASVLCERELPPGTTVPEPIDNEAAQPHRRSLLGSVWEVANILRKVNDELDRRPQPRRPFSTLAWVPVVGAPVLYVGERLALCRAAKAGRTWIAEHPETITVSRRQPLGSPGLHA